MRVLGISGSLRDASYNTQLLRAAGRLFPSDVEFAVWDRLKAVPPYDEDDDRDPAPEGAQRFRDAVAGADAILFATPEYNSSVPGQLKNAIDWASRPLATNALRNKPVAVIGASTGMFGAVWAQAELRKVLAATGLASSRARSPSATRRRVRRERQPQRREPRRSARRGRWHAGRGNRAGPSSRVVRSRPRS